MGLLADLLATRQDEVILRWRARAGAQVPVDELSALVRALRGEAAPSRTPGAAASIDEVIGTYDALRDAVLSVAEDAGAPVTVRELRAVADFASAAVADGVRAHQQRRERAADEERQRLVALVENSSDFIGVANEDGVPVYLNPAGQRLVGLDRPPATTQILDYYAPEARAQAEQEIMPAMLREGYWAGETCFRHLQTGESIAVSDTHFAIREPGTQRLLGYGTITRDVRARKQLEQEREALLAREKVARAEAVAERQKLHATFMQAPVAIVILEGPGHRITFANPEYLAMIGGREIVGKPVLQALPELGPQGIVELLDRVVATGEPFVGTEIPVRLANHDEHETAIYNFVYSPMRNAQGAVDGILACGFDVTQQVRDRARVEQLRTQAEDANRTKDEFLAMLGHELRNPLSPIVTALHLLRLRGPKSRELEVIERQVTHLVRLVDDLLDVARITRGKIELRKRPVEVAEVVLGAIEIASPLLEQRQQRLDLQVPPDGLKVFGDPDRLAQVVSNLLTNAAKYSEPGSGVAVHAEQQGGDVVVRVRDQGVGIAPEMLDSIFESFVQHRQSMDRAAGGLGLGLSIVRSLVALHEGRAYAVSDGPGKGSEFVICLPALSAAGAAASPAFQSFPALERTPARHGRRVLVVDDNADAAALLAELLAGMGFDVRIAHDGPSALRVAEGFRPEIALLDIGLPVMDGYELARRLRAQDDGRAPRLVAITGYGQESDRRRSAEAGFAAHLVKPVEFDALADAVRH